METKDYVIILKHYGVPIPKTRKRKRELAEELMSAKMCNCIKSVQKASKLQEPAAIAICTKSIFQNRGLKYNKLKCKPKPQFVGNKKTKKKLTKTKSKLRFREKKLNKTRKK